MSLLMILSVISLPTLKANAEGGIDGFVERCYTVILGRQSDPDGFADWKNQLVSGTSVGAQVAYGFVFSKEYKEKNKSNKDFVRDLYLLFMDREPDEAGFNDWVKKLDEGKSREEVYVGFVNSQEFYNICDSYGITAGSFVVGYDRNQVNNVNLFVNRLYDTCLGRRGDRKGQQDWVNKLLKKEITGIECARCFVQSKEYINKGLSDEEYVENLYKAFMGRDSDAEGKANWVNALAKGKTRDEVFAGFANSKEFGTICENYKIDKGSYTAKDIGEVKDDIDDNKNTDDKNTTDNNSSDDKKTEDNKTVDNNSDDSSKDTPSGPKFRLVKTTHFDGSYTETKYGKNNEKEFSAIYNSDGSVKRILYKTEVTADGCDKITIGSEDAVDSGYVYVYNKDHTEVSVEYSAVGRLLNKVYRKLDKPDGKAIEEKSISYNENGEITNQTISKLEYYDSGLLKKQSNYTLDGKLVSYAEYEYHGEEQARFHVKYTADSSYNPNGDTDLKRTYDSNGKLVLEEYYVNSVLTDKSIFTYDSNGNQLSKVTYNGTEKTSWHTYEYDSNGNVLKDEYGDKFDASYIYVNTYDTSNNKITSKYYQSGELSYESEFTYDSENRVLKEERKVPGSSYLTKTIYEYNSYGYITRNAVITYPDGPEGLEILSWNEYYEYEQY